MEKKIILLIFLVLSHPVVAFSCDTTQSGDWSNPSTWNNCNGGVPANTNDYATIKDGHTIVFNLDSVIIDGIIMETNSQLTIASSVSGRSLSATSSEVDLTMGELLLESDFTITNNNANVVFGRINGNNNLVINSNQATQFTNTIGENLKLRSITTDAFGVTDFINDIDIYFSSNNETSTIFNDPVTIEKNSSIFIDSSFHSGGLVFNNTILSTGVGSNKLAIVNSNSGPTQIRGNVILNEFNSFQGRTLVSADIQTNNGNLEFNNYLEISGDSGFSTIGTGKMIFNFNIVDDGILNTSSIITFDSPNDIMISSIGFNAPVIDEVISINIGTIYLLGGVNTKNSQTYLGQVIQTHIGRFTSQTDKAYFNGGLDGGDIAMTELNFFSNFTLPNSSLENINSLTMGPMGKTIINADIMSYSFLDFLNSVELTNSAIISGERIRIDNTIDFGNNILTIDSTSDQSRIQGNIMGNSSTLIKSGSGLLSLFGQNSFTGLTQINQGKLLVYGTHASDVIGETDTRFGGSGTVNGTVTINSNAVISPGNSQFVGDIGILTIGDLILAQDGELEIKISGTLAGIDYDQLKVNGTINLNGELNAIGTYSFNIGDSFTIIDNQSNNAINGTLSGVSEGGVFNDHFQITYHGGDGNDVALTSICASSITVSNNLDSGSDSFRQAVIDICPNGTIDFDDAYTIDFGSTIQIDKDISIDGSGQIFTSSNNSSIFTITSGNFVNINNFTIQNTSTSTGAIINSGILIIQNAYFANNTNTSPEGGGGITNFGDVAIGLSSFYQNNASQGGAIYNKGNSFSITNSTMYQNGNVLMNEGGAIYSESLLAMRSVTIIDSGNGNATAGNSIFLTGSNSSMQIANTIVASSNSSISECANFDGAIVTNFPTSAHYLIDDGSCNATFSGSPEVGSWGSYGGFAPTIPLLEGSPMINAGSELYCDFIGLLGDQIGNQRTLGIACDIGAVEFVDTTFPEVINVIANNQTLSLCQSHGDAVNQLQITFSERVLSSEDVNNYLFIQAGVDQSFQTADDVIISVLSAVSDNHQDTPTVTLSIAEPLVDGLVRLIVDNDITDEFYINLNDDIDYPHQFRIEIGNLIAGGHFDDCPNASIFLDWQIIDSPVLLGEDVDQSNASFSFKKSITSTNSFGMAQCINMNSGAIVIMDSYFKENLSQQITRNSKGVNTTFTVEMSCISYDDTECMGNAVTTLSNITSDFTASGQWVNLNRNLGNITMQTHSSECKILVTPNLLNTHEFLIDKIRLFLLDDLIYINGFES